MFKIKISVSKEFIFLNSNIISCGINLFLFILYYIVILLPKDLITLYS